MRTVFKSIGRILQRPKGVANNEKAKISSNNQNVIKNYSKVIHDNGYKSIKLCYLIRDFGYKKRSPQNVVEINQVLEQHGMYCFPALTMKESFRQNLRIYEFPVKQEGHLFDDELELQKYLKKKNAFTSIGVPIVEREISPKRTKDKMDFYQKFNGEHVVIEVKNRDGGKSAVEQLWRYSGFLKHEHPNDPVRKILVTGISDFWTAYAIHGMMQKGRGEIEWYIYKYDRKNDFISLVPMKYENYKKYFSAH